MGKKVMLLGAAAAVVLGTAAALSLGIDKAGAEDLLCSSGTNSATQTANLKCTVERSPGRVSFVTDYDEMRTETTFVFNLLGETKQVITTVDGSSVSQNADGGGCYTTEGSTICTASIHGDLISVTAGPGIGLTSVKEDESILERPAAPIPPQAPKSQTYTSVGVCVAEVNGVESLNGPCSYRQVRNDNITVVNHQFVWNAGNMDMTVYTDGFNVTKIRELTPLDGTKDIIPSSGNCEFGEYVYCTVVYNGVAFEIYTTGPVNDTEY